MTATAAWITARFTTAQLLLLLLVAAVALVVTGITVDHLISTSTADSTPEAGWCRTCH